MIGKAVARVWLLLALAFGGAGAAQAQDFNFSYTLNGVSVMGTFVTTSNNNGSYSITNIINGMRGGNPIMLLAPYSFGGNDNLLLYPANPGYINGNGISYQSQGTNYNFIYYNDGAGGSDTGYYEASNFSSARASNVTVAQVPAPLPGGGLLSFIALGLAALGCGRRMIVGRVRLALARLRPGTTVAA